MPTVYLKAGHLQPVWADHPWIYAQAIDAIRGGATAGDEVEVVDPRGSLLGRGFYSPSSAIAIRILTRDPSIKIDGSFFRQRIQRAIDWRTSLQLPNVQTNGYRLIHAEGDLLPGLIVDRFKDVLVVQFLTIGLKQREGLVLETLQDLLRPRAIVDRTPASSAKMEGFSPGTGVVRGGEVTDLKFKERGLAYRIPLEIAQKIGFYFDQRPLRHRIEQLAKGCRVLDTYSFVGSFAMAAARGGAVEVRAVDESLLALEVGAECARANELHASISYDKRDARKAMQEAGEQGGYDLVIVDPPRFAPSRQSRAQALQAYAKIAELGCRATRPGGILALCCCSAAIEAHELVRALSFGARRANRQAIVWERHFQGGDHPVPAPFSEGLYLKSLLVRVESR